MTLRLPNLIAGDGVTTRRSRTALSLVTAALGIALFVYAVRSAGVDEILDGIGRVGWGLILIIALGGVRMAMRAQCWRWCLPSTVGLSFTQALAAFLAGDAVGSVTPLGLIASEPTKVFLTRHHLATRESVASLALENIVYAASVLTMVVIGAALLLSGDPLPDSVRLIVVVGLIGAIAGLLLLVVLLRSRFDRPRSDLAARLVALTNISGEVRAYAALHPDRLLRVFGLDFLYHALAVLEVFVTLKWLMGSGGPTLVMAIVFETLNRVSTVVFKFVPFRVGVDEALNGGFAPLVGVDPASGVALTVVRKIRNLFWAGVGLLTIALHPAKKIQPKA